MKTHVVAALCLALAGCSASKPPSRAPLLSDEVVSSRGEHLSGRIPRGWFPAAEESLATGAILWLVREDLAAGLAVTELMLDAGSARLVQERGLRALAAASRSLRGLPPQADGKACEELELENGRACGYLLGETAGAPGGRVLVFTRGSHFYECEVVFLRAPAADGPDDAFRVQEAFVEGLTSPSTSS